METTGKTCPKCGVHYTVASAHFGRHAKRGYQSHCNACRQAHRDANKASIAATNKARYERQKPDILAQQRAYYERTADERRATSREYARTHKEANRERNREWRERNPGATTRRVKEWVANNLPRHRSVRARWVEANRESYQAAQRRWAHANPEKVRANVQRVRARRRKAPGSHSAADIRAQHAAQRGRCYWCKEPLARYHVDHVIPLSKGGSNGRENIVISCPPCNARKGAKMPEEFAGVLL